MTRWYRAYEGIVTDAKLGEAAMVAECSRSVAIAAWHAILESCASTNDRGRFSTTARRISVILCEPPKVIEALFSEFASLGMIDGDVVSAWAKRQFESDNSTERSRRHRERRRDVPATLQGRDATPPDTDTDTELSEANASLVADAGDATGEVGNVVKIERKPPSAGKADAVRAAGEWWNDLASSLGLRQIDAIKTGSAREAHAWARCRDLANDYGSLSAGLAEFGAKIRGSPFLTGRSIGRGGAFRATFDWVTNATNFQKIMEGNYEDSQEKRAVR